MLIFFVLRMGLVESVRKLFGFVVFIFLSGVLAAQSSEVELLLSKVDSFMLSGHQNKAIPYLDSALQIRPGQPDLLYQLAQAHFEYGDLDRSYSIVVSLFEENQIPTADMYLLRGKIYHHRLEFESAIRWYKKHLENVPANHPYRKMVANDIIRASSGLRMPGRRIDILVESMGPVINTPADEIRPLFSPNIMERIYFSSNREGSTGGLTDAEGRPDSTYGHHNMDMYMAELIGGQWDNVVFLNEDLNSRVNDIAVDFSHSGRVLYHFRGFSGEIGRVFVDTFGISKPESGYLSRFLSPFVPELGDQGLSFVSDSFIVFSSNRPGGYGGFDLYIALKRNGEWSEAMNLGPEINTEFDELDPFISNGGNELFFSSNRLSSIGQFDIFHARFNPQIQSWSNPVNIGMPLNSAGNDRFFRVSNDGNTCVFASDRKGGSGGYDLYLAYFREEWKDQFADLSSEIVNAFFPVPELPVFLEFDGSAILELYRDAENQNDTLITPLDEVRTEQLLEEVILKEVEEELPRSDKDALEVPQIPEDATIEPEDDAVLEPDEIAVPKFSIQPFYYDESGNIHYPDNVEKANRLADLLEQKPDLDLKLSAFSAHSGPVHLDLFFSVNKAVEIANIIIDRGIHPSRITVIGYGSQYPLALNQVNREPFYAGQEANRRVEPALFQDGRMYHGIDMEGKIIPESFGSSRYRDFKKQREEVSFKVQIGATRSMLNIPEINRYAHPMIERVMSSEFYRYTVGLEKTFERAEVFRDQIKMGGIENAFIVPYMDGKRLSSDMVKKFSVIFGELIHLN
ncbi:MAG: hypothetical protein EA409_10480 [Saprospirales bacterium]|nr:MAG: hypothetical protein EA409_10480 [Saprospirales bacterium]